MGKIDDQNEKNVNNLALGIGRLRGHVGSQSQRLRNVFPGFYQEAQSTNCPIGGKGKDSALSAAGVLF